jgi:hypothetical protein
MLDGLAVATHGGLPMEVPDGGLPASVFAAAIPGGARRRPRALLPMAVIG